MSALRVYKLKGTILTDITKDVTITSANGLPVISYSLIDGGDYDEDGTVNGTIVDPIYIGVVNASATTTPSSSAGTLAATGANAWAPLLIGGSLLLSGSGSLLRRRQ